MRRAAVFAALVVTLAAVAVSAFWAFSTGSASSSSSLACTVRDTSCNVGEVEVFRMSSTANAHAGAAGSPTYTNLVCCGGVQGLGTNCSGTHDTVLRLSATDNAHAQASGSYPTEVCLSADTVEVVKCMFASSCDGGYACLATASGIDNAHVTDCDDVDDYATKVCCYAGVSRPVGGVAELPEGSDSSGHNYIALAGLAAAALVALSAGVWYGRRRLS